MTTEQLPEGLNIAVEMIGEYVESIIVSNCDPATGRLSPAAEFERRDGATAIDAIRAEHQQRITLQHHACDLERRIAELEAERDELRARLDAAAGQEPVAEVRTWHKSNGQHADLIDWCDAIENLPDGDHRLYAAPVPAQAAPEGWRLVPVEPTPDMLDAARSQSSFPLGVYRAMLAASPEAAR